MSNTNGSQHVTVLQAVFGYTPSNPAAIVAGTLFCILSLVLFFRLIRRKDWWGLWLPIGTMCYSFGFFLRIVVADNPDSIGLFIVMQLLTVTSPAFFLAFNYIIYGRLIRNRVGDQYCIIRPQIVARVFVISDGTTFGIQGAGGGIESNDNSATLGSRILLIGLIAQTASYIVFVFLLVNSHWRIRKDLIFVESHAFMRIVYLLYLSSVFIVIRGVYRVIEFAQGHLGFLITHEVYFYVLDALPLFLATVMYAPFWPGVYISPVPREELFGLQKLSNPYNVPNRE